jgi:hypothetical protein
VRHIPEKRILGAADEVEAGEALVRRAHGSAAPGARLVVALRSE